MFKDLVLKSRSDRRFDEHHTISGQQVRGLVELARLTPSGANRQPLKYMLSCEPESNGLISPHLNCVRYGDVVA